MPFGSFFSKFKEIRIKTADNKEINFKNNFLSRIGFKILGVPHIGMRLRARKIVKNLPAGKIGRMLDAGCGTGIYSFSMSERVDKIFAVDISSEKINYLKEISISENVEFDKGDLTKLKFRNNSFDLIICSEVLEHIRHDKKAFAELARVLKKGGTLMTTVPYDSDNNRKDYRKYEHERPGYRPEQFEIWCKESGLKLVNSEGYSYPLTEKIFNACYKFYNKKIILGVIFYPLYLASIISEMFQFGEPNGLFMTFRKN